MRVSFSNSSGFIARVCFGFGLLFGFTGALESEDSEILDVVIVVATEDRVAMHESLDVEDGIENDIGTCTGAASRL